jgi:alpha/beta superfamily hydrolase
VNTFFFGTSQRQLFGAYDPPRGAGRRGAVLCQPLAREYLLAHPTIRHLARLLSAEGSHALRFDYSGTGDSAGELADTNQEQWLADVAAAVDELKDLGQLSRVDLVGMRYGAALAAQVAGRQRDVERLVLWDPVFDGRAYLAEPDAHPQPVPASGDLEVRGVVLPAALRREMEGVTLASFGSGLPRTLVVETRSAAGASEPLRAHLVAAGVDCTLEHVPDVQVWREEWGQGGVGMAVAAASRIVAWLK